MQRTLVIQEFDTISAGGHRDGRNLLLDPVTLGECPFSAFMMTRRKKMGIL